jgi:hypothetical protein
LLTKKKKNAFYIFPPLGKVSLLLRREHHLGLGKMEKWKNGK